MAIDSIDPIRLVLHYGCACGASKCSHVSDAWAELERRDEVLWRCRDLAMSRKTGAIRALVEKEVDPPPLDRKPWQG